MRLLLIAAVIPVGSSALLHVARPIRRHGATWQAAAAVTLAAAAVAVLVVMVLPFYEVLGIGVPSGAASRARGHALQAGQSLLLPNCGSLQLANLVILRACCVSWSGWEEVQDESSSSSTRSTQAGRRRRSAK